MICVIIKKKVENFGFANMRGGVFFFFRFDRIVFPPPPYQLRANSIGRPQQALVATAADTHTHSPSSARFAPPETLKIRHPPMAVQPEPDYSLFTAQEVLRFPRRPESLDPFPPANTPVRALARALALFCCFSRSTDAGFFFPLVRRRRSSSSRRTS